MPIIIFKRCRLPCCMLLILCISSACGLIYKQNVQQGNALEQKDLDELYIGMNKRKVSFVLGSPAIHDPFNQQRWDYLQTFSKRGGKLTERIVTLRFKDDLLVEIIGANQTPKAAAAASPSASTPPADSTKPAAAAGANPGATPETKKENQQPEIKGLGDRSAQDRDLKEEQKATQPGTPDDGTPPDGGG